MGDPHIFVCYDVTDTAYETTSLTLQLISDLRRAGAEVITDSSTISNQAFMRFLDHALLQCQWLILVQTTQALQSLRVQISVNTALHLVVQQRMKGVFRLVISSADLQDEPFVWTTLREFDARQDYARARDKVLLELGLLRVDDEPDELQQTLLLPVPANAQRFLPAPRDIPAGYRPSGGLEKFPSCPPWVSLDRPSHYKSTRKPSQPEAMAIFLKSLITGLSTALASSKKIGKELLLQNHILPLAGHHSSLSMRQTQRFWLVLSAFVLLLILLLIGVSLILKGSAVNHGREGAPLAKPSPTVHQTVLHTTLLNGTAESQRIYLRTTGETFGFVRAIC